MGRPGNSAGVSRATWRRLGATGLPHACITPALRCSVENPQAGRDQRLHRLPDRRETVAHRHGAKVAVVYPLRYDRDLEVAEGEVEVQRGEVPPRRAGVPLGELLPPGE